MATSRTEPFKATCHLLDGRLNSADGLIYLDSILYHGWFAKYAPHVLEGKSGNDRPPHFGLPLRQLPNNRYASSCGFYAQHSVDIEHWVKRPNFTNADAMDYLDAERSKKIQTSAGPFRAYRRPNVIRLVGPIEFYGYGTISKIEELLKYVPAVGKKPAMGWGTIGNWDIEPWPEDWSTHSPLHGLMRPMPTDEYSGDDRDRYAIRECAIRPPAWKACNQMLCYVPEVISNADNE